MKNKIVDLNDHLFAQLERLGDEDLTAEAIEREVSRATAMVRVADQIVAAAALQLRAVELVAQHGDRHAKHLPMLAGSATPGLTVVEGKRA